MDTDQALALPSIPGLGKIGRAWIPLGGYRIVAIMSASQALETGSIPVTRSRARKARKRHVPNADVAQLVEQCFRKAKVAGSNPAIGST